MELRKANLTNPVVQTSVLYNDGELALCQDMHDALTLLPIQMEIYAIVLVMEGKGRIEINGKPYEIKKNDLFICPPNNIVENGLMSLDFKGCFIFVSSDYVQRVMPLQGAWEFKTLFEKKSCMSSVSERSGCVPSILRPVVFQSPRFHSGTKTGY